MTLNCTHQLFVYADDVNVLGRSIHTTKKNTVALVFASKEIWLEVNADKTKYMVMSWDQSVGQRHIVKTERVEEFRYLGNEQIEVRECLLSLGAESFVFQFAI